MAGRGCGRAPARRPCHATTGTADEQAHGRTPGQPQAHGRATRPPGRPDQGPGDDLLDLVAVALSTGASLPHALRLAGGLAGEDADAARVALWLELGAQGVPPRGWKEVGPLLAAARGDGVPLAGLVRSLAVDRRRAAHHTALQRAARLGARLTLPTTLLLLPAAGLVVAAPLLHGALSALT